MDCGWVFKGSLSRWQSEYDSQGCFPGSQQHPMSYSVIPLRVLGLHIDKQWVVSVVVFF